MRESENLHVLYSIGSKRDIKKEYYFVEKKLLCLKNTNSKHILKDLITSTLPLIIKKVFFFN